MAFNYVVTAHKATAVSDSLVGSFTAPDASNLIMARSNQLQVYTVGPEASLLPVIDTSIYGRIRTMKLYHSNPDQAGILFLCTDRYDFCALRYDAATASLKTISNGTAREVVGRPNDCGQLGEVDPSSKVIALHLYDGQLKVLPIEADGQLGTPFNLRLEELQVLSLTFLDTDSEHPVLAVLHNDSSSSGNSPGLKTYCIDVANKCLSDGPWSPFSLEDTSEMLIPVPQPIGGLMVISEESVIYVNGPARKATALPYAGSQMLANGCVQHDRWLLGDASGKLYVLMLQVDAANGVEKVNVTELGTTSQPKALCYLDQSVLFLGSEMGDSQLIKLNTVPSEDGSLIEVIESFTNLGPIVDFAVVDLHRQGQGQVVTCSGVRGDGSLRVVRSGVGMQTHAVVPLPSVKGIWSLKSTTDAPHAAFLVVSFLTETKLLALDEDDQLGEAEISGFHGHAQTLLCSNVDHGQLLQVLGHCQQVCATN